MLRLWFSIPSRIPPLHTSTVWQREPSRSSPCRLIPVLTNDRRISKMQTNRQARVHPNSLQIIAIAILVIRKSLNTKMMCTHHDVSGRPCPVPYCNPLPPTLSQKNEGPPQIFHETLTRNKLVFHERNLITKLDCMDILFLSRKFKTPSNFLL